MCDDPAVLLRNAWQEAWYILERNQRDIEAIAKANKACTLNGSRDIQNTGQKCGLVSDDSHWAPAESCESDANVLSKHLLNFKEVAVVDHMIDYFANVVGLVRGFGNDSIEFCFNTIDGIVDGYVWRILKVV